MTEARLQDIRSRLANSGSGGMHAAIDLLAYVDELLEHMARKIFLSSCCRYTGIENGIQHEQDCWEAKAYRYVNFALPEGHSIQESTDASDNAKTG